MTQANSHFARELETWGALPAQVVDLELGTESRILRYLDLCNDPPGGRPPLIVEQAGQPRIHVYDGRQTDANRWLPHWCLRTALRGDGSWVAVLEPGRLRVFGSGEHPREQAVGSHHDVVPRFLYDTRAATADVATRGYLLGLLKKSVTAATTLGLSQDDALSFVGRGLFWRFLVDRNLLDGLKPRDVSPGAETWAQCLDSKARALRTFDWLDDTFNGGLLPFKSSPGAFNSKVFHEVLGNISYGATASGQLRLPTDWSEVNFGHIPVGLLSEVYEAFAHSTDPERARAESIHYTPRHIAEFLVSEALASMPHEARPRVLDPAAGAGVFLVTAFRHFAEREWQHTGVRPRRTALRRILTKQLAGFDINPSALRLAELALYITALDLDPDPRPLKALRFDELRGHVLFAQPEGVSEGSLGSVEERFRAKFDLVVGNPPWTAHAKGVSVARQWAKDTRSVVVDRLGEDRARTFQFPDTNPDLPFVWRAMEWAKPGGAIALVTHARWLFGLSDRSARARRDLLEGLHVTGLLNGAALRRTSVWPNVHAPFSFLFATNERPPPNAAFQFVSPVLDETPDKAQSRMRIDWQDAQIVPVRELLEKPWTLKTRYRGNRLAARVLDRILSADTRLGEYLESLGTGFRNGYQVGGKAGKQVSAATLRGLPDLKGFSSRDFVLDTAALPPFSRKTLLFPRDRANYRAPLLLLGETVSTDWREPRALRSEDDVAFHQSFHGVSFHDVPSGSYISRYLQLVLQSSIYVFFELLCDARYGIERDTVYLESVETLPVVPFADLNATQRKRSEALSRQVTRGLTQALIGEIDNFIFDLYGLSATDREAVRDTLATAGPSTLAKKTGIRPPDSSERASFAQTLSASLDNVLSASGLHSSVHERDDLILSPWRFIQVDVISDAASTPELVQLSTRPFLDLADDGGASLVTFRVTKDTWLLGLLERYALWTSTRARLLATDLIAQRSSYA